MDKFLISSNRRTDWHIQQRCGTWAWRLVVRLTKRYSRAQIENDEMGGTRGMYRKEQKLIQGCGGETWQEETPWKTYGRTSRWILKEH